MSIKDYMSSGVIEQYALGALTAHEKAEFEQKLMLYPELRKELNKVRESLENYSRAYSISPPAELSAKIRARYSSVSNGSSNRFRSTVQKHYLTYKYLLAASLAALIISTFASWFFYSRWDEAENRHLSVRLERNQLNAQLEQMSNALDKTVAELMILKDPWTEYFQFQASDSIRSGPVRIFWNPVNYEVHIFVNGLPAAPDGLQYQVWALYEGIPYDAGVLSKHDESNELIRLKDIARADGWAISLEHSGGSELPTEGQIVLSTKQPERPKQAKRKSR